MRIISKIETIALRAIAAVLVVGLAAMMSSCSMLYEWRDRDKGIQIGNLQGPPGYRVTIFASGLPTARHMVMGNRGTLFVGSSEGNVYALSLNGSTVVRQRVLVSGLTDPSGVAFHDGALFVADRTRILRFDQIEQRLDSPGEPVVVIDGFPNKSRHDAHAMNFGPDGKLYVAVGSPCDTCEADNDEFGTIIRSYADGTGREVVARGIRNSVGFDWHPQSRELWFTDNGQDGLGPARPNDELNRVSRAGEHFGFPYCHDRDISDPDFGAKRKCSEFTSPEFGLGAHVGALGMRFDTRADTGTPAGDDVGILIARHGSHPPIRVGYDVVRVVMQAGKPDRMEPFLSGFLQGRRYWGRPVDVLVMGDGSVLVSDDMNGAIYRVSRKT